MLQIVITLGLIFDKQLGLPLTIKRANEEHGLVHEVKRVGFLIDRLVELQLRVGDSLVVYL